MKTEIKKAKNTEFEPFEIVVQIEDTNQASVFLHMIQRELPEHNQLREKVEYELRRQGWSI